MKSQRSVRTVPSEREMRHGFPALALTLRSFTVSVMRAARTAHASHRRAAQSLRLAVVFFALGFWGLPAQTSATFQGYIVTDDRPLFVIATANDGSSGWLTIGQRFAGFSIVNFDKNAEHLTVEKEGARQTLRLVEGRIQLAKRSANDERKNSILISVDGIEPISVGDEADSMQALKERLAIIATTAPKPHVTIHYPRDGPARQMVPIMNLIKASGITRISIRTH